MSSPAHSNARSIHFSALDELYEGHRSAYLRMLESAYTQCYETKHTIDQALKEQDAETLHHAVHKMRPLLKMLQYETFLHALEELSTAFDKKQPLRYPPPSWEELLSALQSKRKRLHMSPSTSP